MPGLEIFSNGKGAGDRCDLTTGVWTLPAGDVQFAGLDRDPGAAGKPRSTGRPRAAGVARWGHISKFFNASDPAGMIVNILDHVYPI